MTVCLAIATGLGKLVRHDVARVEKKDNDRTTTAHRLLTVSTKRLWGLAAHDTARVVQAAGGSVCICQGCVGLQFDAASKVEKDWL